MDVGPLVKTYPDVSQLAFGIKRRSLMVLFMYLELYLVVLKFLILEVDNLEKYFQV